MHGQLPTTHLLRYVAIGVRLLCAIHKIPTFEVAVVLVCLNGCLENWFANSVVKQALLLVYLGKTLPRLLTSRGPDKKVNLLYVTAMEVPVSIPSPPPAVHRVVLLS